MNCADSILIIRNIMIYDLVIKKIYWNELLVRDLNNYVYV